MLYLVATPIGNLRDITLRAIDILQKVEYIACEDTRRAHLLLQFIAGLTFTLPKEPKPMLFSYYEQNEYHRIPNLLNLLRNGKDIALISDAGTPTISDPGFKLVRACVTEGIKVEAIPGPSALLTALVSSGLPTDKFLFLGYLPKKVGNRRRVLESTRSSLDVLKTTVILYEAPHRLTKTLLLIQEVFYDMQLVLAKELSKIHENVASKRVSEWLLDLAGKNPKGEYVILFNIHEQRDA